MTTLPFVVAIHVDETTEIATKIDVRELTLVHAGTEDDGVAGIFRTCGLGMPRHTLTVEPAMPHYLVFDLLAEDPDPYPIVAGEYDLNVVLEVFVEATSGFVKEKLQASTAVTVLPS